MEDLRCCGSGTCIINAEGRCWCGQQWDGDRMCFPDPAPAQDAAPPPASAAAEDADGSN